MSIVINCCSLRRCKHSSAFDLQSLSHTRIKHESRSLAAANSIAHTDEHPWTMTSCKAGHKTFVEVVVVCEMCILNWLWEEVFLRGNESCFESSPRCSSWAFSQARNFSFSFPWLSGLSARISISRSCGFKARQVTKIFFAFYASKRYSLIFKTFKQVNRANFISFNFGSELSYVSSLQRW